MGTIAPPQPYYPQIDKEIPAKITVHLQRIYPWLNNHESAILALNSKVEAISTASAATTSTNTVTTITNSVTDFPGLGLVSDQTGATSYTTQTQDNGAMIIVDDASPVAVTLNSTVTRPYLFFITNLGAGTATLTPTSGLIDGGASFSLLSNCLSMVVFDGTNWSASASQVVPVNTPAVAHQWLASYNATTGAFTQGQPAIADITGLAAALAALAPIASPTFTGTVTQPTPSVLTAATTATSATAGAASALPATPAGYLEISINGTVFKVPYYAI